VPSWAAIGTDKNKQNNKESNGFWNWQLALIIDINILLSVIFYASEPGNYFL
jgi:hypothetical protein